MPFPNVPLLDAFGSDQDPLSTNWGSFDGADGPLRALSGVARSQSGSASFFYSRRTDVSGAVLAAAAQLTALPGLGFFASIPIRVQGTGGAWYEVGYSQSDGEVNIYRLWNSGADDESLAAIENELSAGDWLGIVSNGTTHAAWAGPTFEAMEFVTSAVDANYSTGGIALGGFGSTFRWDNYRGGVVDLVAPNTTIDSGPNDPTTDTDAEFEISADEEDCTFEVRLDGGSWVAASGTPANGSGETTVTHTIDGPLSVGEHTLDARATDASDNEDVTPASFTWTVEEAPAAPQVIAPSGPPKIWVQTIENGGDGQGHILGDVEDLSWSNVDPGGDEVASFTLRKPWGMGDLREIGRGCMLRIGCGLDVLWQGRIEEHDRGGDQSEEVRVTAYGLGARLKDQTVAEVYRDEDLGSWGDVSRGRRIALLGLNWTLLGYSVEPDEADGLPSLNIDGSGRWSGAGVCNVIYDAGETARIGYVRYDWTAENLNAGGLTAATWSGSIGGADDDRINGPVGGTDVLTGGSSGSRLEAAMDGQRVAWLQLFYSGSSSSDSASRSWTVRPAVYGTHGLVEAANGGFTVDQIVADVIDRIEGTEARNIDAQDYEVMQAEWREPTRAEQILEELNSYVFAAWGTWGPDSPLDPSTNGQFDFRNRDLTKAHWFAARSELDDSPDFHSETSSLFDTVHVRFTDISGRARVVTRTREVPLLSETGIGSRETTIDGGRLPIPAAETLGDAFLALSGGFAPARGSVSISRPIRHQDRGMLWPCYLRADGSNLRIPDILPTRDVFDLSSEPDRRTTFPIKRVTVSAGEKIVAQVELDQSNDLMSVLQARSRAGDEVLLG